MLKCWSFTVAALNCIIAALSCNGEAQSRNDAARNRNDAPPVGIGEAGRLRVAGQRPARQPQNFSG